MLLLAAFRSLPLAAATIGLNLLSLGATYGVLSAVFQHEWAEGILGFESDGVVTTWLPLFAFVILFGLSMDYTILVLERMREARRAGADAREAAAEGVAATGGTVTSAALVMVAVFAVFATLRMVENKMLGVSLSRGDPDRRHAGARRRPAGRGRPAGRPPLARPHAGAGIIAACPPTARRRCPLTTGPRSRSTPPSRR